jgi:hypothetical protein
MPTAHGSSYAHAPTPTIDSLGDPQHDSTRGAGEALSRLGSAIPFIGQLKQGLGLFLIQAYSPILKPFEVLNLVTNRMFSRLAPGFADKSYELFYKLIPTGIISKAAGKIGLGGGITNQVSKFLTGGLAKTGIKISDEDIKSLTNELGKSLSDIYNPKFLKQFDNFFTRALQGDGVYMEVADVLIEKALANVGDTVTKALSRGVSAISDGTAQAAGTEAITKTTQKTAESVKQKADAANKKTQNTQKQIVDDNKQVLNTGKQIANQAVQSITPQTQKPATGTKAQGPNNNSQAGLFSNLLTNGSNILKSITAIFSPKAAPAVA